MTASETKFVDVTSFSFKEFNDLAQMDNENRLIKIANKTSTKYSKEEALSVASMTTLEELVAVLLFLFGIPGAVFSIPVVLLAIGLATGHILMSFAVGLALLLPLSFMPAPLSDAALSSWPALQVLRYFSFKVLYKERLELNKPYILVAPPHGVFPFGNIATLIAFPSIMGFSFNALAATAAIRMPIFRQLLCAIGGIDASKNVALAALNRNRTIGISTGGVAEIFETNTASGDEVIVLKNRKGIIKLAFQTGAALVPCYLFGNTHLLSLWTGGSFHDQLKSLSRRLGAALILFWGRFGLPIPYRVPIVGTMARPIHVGKKENPTEQEIDEVHQRLMDDMVKMFNEHKATYGWEKKKLIIM